MDTRNDVELFMRAADQTVATGTNQPFTMQSQLYMDLIKEEFSELGQAFREFDKVEIADACADLIWVIEGLCLTLGIPLQQVWDEVARSNHSKISETGKIVKRIDGKVLKPDTYSPPNIKPIIKKYATSFNPPQSS